LKKILVTAVVFAATALALAAWQRFAEPAPDGSQPTAAEERPPVPVAVVEVKAVQFPEQVEALGTTQALEAVEITPRITSIVTQVRFREGQQVKTGEVLVELEDAEEQAALAETEAGLIDSRSQYARASELARTQVVSESQLKQLEATMKADEARLRAAQARLDQTRVRAPFAGRTGLRQVSPGSLVTPGTVITTLDDLSSVRLDFTVPETFLSVLREGMSVTAESVAWTERRFEGEVQTVDTRVDPATRAVTVRAVIPNDDLSLKPGMFLTVELAGPERQTLLLPEAALVPQGERQFVYVIRDGRAWRTEVAIGRRLRGSVEVTGGLSEGDEVVVEGTQRLADGTRVRRAPAVFAVGTT
jgi:membrane fusion protein (multidrug efflux system)